MAVSRTEDWATMTYGTEPQNVSFPIGNGGNRMMCCIVMRERYTDFVVSEFSIGGEDYDYTAAVTFDTDIDLSMKAFFWDEESIENFTSGITRYIDDLVTTKISWSVATFADVRQVEPTVETEISASATYLDITSTSSSNDMLIGALLDGSSNRAPLDYDTLTERAEHSVEQMASGIADGSGGDGTTRLSNDGLASKMVGMVINLQGFATSLTDSAGRGVMRGVSRGIM